MLLIAGRNGFLFLRFYFLIREFLTISQLKLLFFRLQWLNINVTPYLVRKAIGGLVKRVQDVRVNQLMKNETENEEEKKR